MLTIFCEILPLVNSTADIFQVFFKVILRPPSTRVGRFSRKIPLHNHGAFHARTFCTTSFHPLSYARNCPHSSYPILDRTTMNKRLAYLCYVNTSDLKLLQMEARKQQQYSCYYKGFANTTLPKIRSRFRRKLRFYLIVKLAYERLYSLVTRDVPAIQRDARKKNVNLLSLLTGEFAAA